MRRLGAIAGRETGAFFHSAMAPVALGGFLVLTGLFFTFFLLGFSELSLQQTGGGAEVALNLSERVFQPLVGDVAIFLLFLLPAVSMRVLSGEYRSGRYDLLASYPVADHVWIVGKWLSVMAVAALLIAGAGAYVGITAWLGSPEPGPPVAAGLGLLLLAGAFAAWGVLFSALFQYQLISYFLSFAFLFIMFALSNAEPFLPPAVAPILNEVAWGEHFARFTRGVVDSRDVWFFLAWTALGLSAGTAVLAGRRLAGRLRPLLWLPTLVLAVLLTLLQVLVVRHPLSLDLTSNRRYSLAPQTEQVLASLERPVRVLAFYERLDPTRRPLEVLLRSLHDRSRKIDFLIVDPIREATLVEQYGVTSPRTVVVEMGDKRTTILQPGEGALVNAIYRLATGTRPVIYHLLGHGEHRLDSEDRGGYSGYATALAEQGYLVRPLLLADRPLVPSDADVVVLSSPKLELSEAETAALLAHLERGGSLLLLLDPGTPAGIAAWVADFNLVLGDDFIVSGDSGRRSFGVDPRVVVISDTYGDHPAVAGMAGVTTLFPLTQSLSLAAAEIVGVDPKWILRTGSGSWAERDLDTIASGSPVYEPGRDRPGPVVFGVAATVDREEFFGEPAAAAGPGEGEAEEEADLAPIVRQLRAMRGGEGEGPSAPGMFGLAASSRLIVLGDSDFAANANLGLYGNRDLLLDLVGWLARENVLVALRPRPARQEPLILSVTQRRLLSWLAIGVWPLGVALVSAGVVIRHRRRH